MNPTTAVDLLRATLARRSRRAAYRDRLPAVLLLSPEIFFVGMPLCSDEPVKLDIKEFNKCVKELNKFSFKDHLILKYVSTLSAIFLCAICKF